MLTVYLSTFLINNQLDAIAFSYNFILFLHMFRAVKSSSSRVSIYQYNVRYMSLYEGDRLVCRFRWNSSSI